MRTSTVALMTLVVLLVLGQVRAELTVGYDGLTCDPDRDCSGHGRCLRDLICLCDYKYYGKNCSYAMPADAGLSEGDIAGTVIGWILAVPGTIGIMLGCIWLLESEALNNGWWRKLFARRSTDDKVHSHSEIEAGTGRAPSVVPDVKTAVP